MTRNVKTSPEKKINVEKIIYNLLETNGLKLEDFLYRTAFSMDAYRKSIERGSLSKGIVENIMDNFDVNKGYLLGTEGLTSSGKLTSVHDEAAITEKPLGESWEANTFRKMFEGGTDYILVPRTALDGRHRFTSVEQMELQAKELEEKSKEIARKDDQIKSLTTALTEMMKDLSGRIPQPPKIQET